jgi:EAL domain-containing protein (putative c-di-GMP-specific phosphodiesterase class I)
VLFEAARREGMIVDLDRLCRDVVLQEYKSIQREKEDSLLFLNFESSLLNAVVPGNSYLFDQVMQRDINPSNVVIEIIESEVSNTDNLITFVNFYRQKGFLIALDDVGTGYSNFDRITAIKPDILKVDKSILKDLENNYYKQEVFKSLGSLAKKTGELILAEGVETREEVLCAMDLNADLAQGYFFARPQPYNAGIDENAHEVISQVKDHFKNYKIRKIMEVRKQHQLYDDTLKSILGKISDKIPHDFDGLLKEIIDEFLCVDAQYILDNRGIQYTDTVLNEGITSRNKIFQSAKKSDDLSLKEYFYFLVDSGLPKYTTESYISFATGNLCRTITTTFRGIDNQLYVLCMDVSKTAE